MQSMQRSYKNTNNRIRDQTEMIGVQYNDNPIAPGCLGGCMRRVTNQIGRTISDEMKTRTSTMVKTVLFESAIWTDTRRVIQMYLLGLQV